LCDARKLTHVAYPRRDAMVPVLLGVRVGYTRFGLKPCLHPLLAVIAEVLLVAQSPWQ
jgi:hypothetical protein